MPCPLPKDKYKNDPNHYQKLKEVIQKASKEKFWQAGTNPHDSFDTDSCYGSWDERLPLTLADIIIAIRDKFGSRVKQEFKDTVINLLMGYSLHDDSLDLQSDETKLFLYNLLVKE